MKILIIDDEEHIRMTFKMRLSQFGYDVFDAPDGNTALKILSDMECHVVITDLRMPGMSGEEVVKRIHTQYPDIAIVVITGYASIESAVEVIKSGAVDFLTKPLNFDYVKIVLNKIKERLLLNKENKNLKKRMGALNTIVSERFTADKMIGKSLAMQDIFKMINTVAPLDSTVLLTGETGTGKELTAQIIHYASRRKAHPLITVDCGALSETLLESELFGHEKGAFTGAHKSKIGRFELADGGTIFLDEIANSSSNVQKKLLRIIQEKTFERLGSEITRKTDVRIIVATNKQLDKLVKEGTFRSDLFYRLNVIPILLPPLRDRKEDIPVLAEYFLEKFARQISKPLFILSRAAMDQIVSYPWPGNIRELINMMERLSIITNTKEIKNIPFEGEQISIVETSQSSFSLTPSLKTQVIALERLYLIEALKTFNGSIKDVAEISGLSLRTVHRKMNEYGLEKQDYK